MLSRRAFLSFSACALAAGASLLSTGCARTADAEGGLGASSSDAYGEPARTTVFAFDTVSDIEAYCPQDVLDEVEDRLRYFEGIFSRTVVGSDVYAINHADGMPTEVSPETAEVIAEALRYAELSDGLFDITIGAVTQLWDFKNGVVPDSQALARALEHVDWRGVGVRGTVVTLTDPYAAIDLGGIAKGYIADDVARLLRERGCESALINLGGNTYALGTRPDGTPWSVGLQDPGKARGTVYAQVQASDLSIVASGIEERGFEKDGVYYHHLLDPRTGMPVANGTASVTIASARSVDGDACSTIAFLLGAEEGLAFIEEQPGIEALFIGTDESSAASKGFPPCAS